MSIIKLEKYKIIFKDKNNYINFAKYSENIKSIKNISRNEKSICRTTLQNIRWEGTGKHFFHIIKWRERRCEGYERSNNTSYKWYASGISGRNPDKKRDECALPGHQKQSDSRRTAFKIKKISCRGGNAGASNPGNKSSRAGAAEWNFK